MRGESELVNVMTIVMTDFEESFEFCGKHGHVSMADDLDDNWWESSPVDNKTGLSLWGSVLRVKDHRYSG